MPQDPADLDRSRILGYSRERDGAALRLDADYRLKPAYTVIKAVLEGR